MASVVRFPGSGGYDVTIIRKQDVLDCIDSNIIDKEVALDLISKLEIDATTLISAGYKANFPYLGSISYPEVSKLLHSPEVKDNIMNARKILDKESYIMFRKKVAKDIAIKTGYERYYKWRVAGLVKHQNKKFKELAAEKGEAFARFYLFSVANLCAVDNEVIYIQYGIEQESDN